MTDGPLDRMVGGYEDRKPESKAQSTPDLSCVSGGAVHIEVYDEIKQDAGREAVVALGNITAHDPSDGRLYVRVIDPFQNPKVPQRAVMELGTCDEYPVVIQWERVPIVGGGVTWKGMAFDTEKALGHYGDDEIAAFLYWPSRMGEPHVFERASIPDGGKGQIFAGLGVRYYGPIARTRE